MYETEEKLRNAVIRLEGEVGVLREAIELLVSNCVCTVAERYSGHLVDCPIPHVRELLQGDPAVYEEEKDSRAREGV